MWCQNNNPRFIYIYIYFLIISYVILEFSSINRPFTNLVLFVVVFSPLCNYARENIKFTITRVRGRHFLIYFCNYYLFFFSFANCQISVVNRETNKCKCFFNVPS